MSPDEDILLRRNVYAQRLDRARAKTYKKHTHVVSESNASDHRSFDEPYPKSDGLGANMEYTYTVILTPLITLYSTVL